MKKQVLIFAIAMPSYSYTSLTKNIQLEEQTRKSRIRYLKDEITLNQIKKNHPKLKSYEQDLNANKKMFATIRQNTFRSFSHTMEPKDWYAAVENLNK